MGQEEGGADAGSQDVPKRSPGRTWKRSPMASSYLGFKNTKTFEVQTWLLSRGRGFSSEDQERNEYQVSQDSSRKRQRKN